MPTAPPAIGREDFGGSAQLLLCADWKGVFSNIVRRKRMTKSMLSREEVLTEVTKALEAVQYGEIIIKMENGKPIWIDIHEKKRVG